MKKDRKKWKSMLRKNEWKINSRKTNKERKKEIRVKEKLIVWKWKKNAKRWNKEHRRHQKEKENKENKSKMQKKIKQIKKNKENNQVRRNHYKRSVVEK